MHGNSLRTKREEELSCRLPALEVPVEICSVLEWIDAADGHVGCPLVNMTSASDSHSREYFSPNLLVCLYATRVASLTHSL